MKLDVENALYFTLAFKNDHYKIKAQAILRTINRVLQFDGSYIVEIQTPSNEGLHIIYEINQQTGEFFSYFKLDLHPDIINKIGNAISDLTS